MRQFDFVVIGSGLAGLSFARSVAGHGTVAIITKRGRADSNTAWAQGGIACVTSSEDSFELHVKDTLEAGAGLCDEADGARHRHRRPGAHPGAHRTGRAIRRAGARGRRAGTRPWARGRPLEAPRPARPGRHRPRDRARPAGRHRAPPAASPCSRTTWPWISSPPASSATPPRTAAWASTSWMRPPATSMPSGPTASSSPPAAAGRSISTPPIPASPPATAWPWPGAPGRISRTWSSSSSIPPASTIPRRARS